MLPYLKPMLALVLLTGSVLLAGCSHPDKELTIEYEQDANFYTYKIDPQSAGSFSAAEGMFIQYRIMKITNTGNDPVTFTFDKDRVISVQDAVSKEHAAGENVLLGSYLLDGTTYTLDPGESVSAPDGLGCFILHAKTDDPQSMTARLVDLLHEVGDPTVSMARYATDDTTATIGTATPEVLQNRCSGQFF